MRPSREHAEMQEALGVLRRSARGPADPSSLSDLSVFARRVGGPAGATIAAGVILLSQGPWGLCGEIDPLLLRQSPLSICAMGDPGPLLPGLPALLQEWVEALRRGGKTLGVHAYRAFIGDVAEALYRVVQRGGPPARLEGLLSEADRAFLQDTVTIELPGTSDFLAARPMVWLLGLLGTLDDAGISAIERARDRFRNEAFHADCAVILAGGPWPPGLLPSSGSGG